MSAFTIARMEIEVWMAQHLGNPALFAGVTNDSERKERVRRTIIDLGLEHVEAGKNARGERERWGQLFCRVYHEPLRQKNKQTEAGTA